MFYRFTINQRISWYRKGLRMVKKRLPDWCAEEAFAQCWRTPIAQCWSRIILQQKAPIDFDQETLNCPKMFFTVFYYIDSQFSFFFQYVAHARNLVVFIKEKCQFCFQKTVISVLPGIEKLDFIYTGIAFFCPV